MAVMSTLEARSGDADADPTVRLAAPLPLHNEARLTGFEPVTFGSVDRGLERRRRSRRTTFLPRFFGAQRRGSPPSAAEAPDRRHHGFPLLLRRIAESC